MITLQLQLGECDCVCVVFGVLENPAVLTKFQQPSLLASVKHILSPSREMVQLNFT